MFLPIIDKEAYYKYMKKNLPLGLMLLTTLACQRQFVQMPIERSVPHSNTPSSLIFSTTPHALFHVELAITAEELRDGLMGRRVLERNQGMLFIFSNEKILGFWMKNTLIALDIIFMDKNLTIVHIAKNAVPMSLDIISSIKPAKYALEIAGGGADEHQLRTGLVAKFFPTRGVEFTN